MVMGYRSYTIINITNLMDQEKQSVSLTSHYWSTLQKNYWQMEHSYLQRIAKVSLFIRKSKEPREH